MSFNFIVTILNSLVPWHLIIFKVVVFRSDLYRCLRFANRITRKSIQIIQWQLLLNYITFIAIFCFPATPASRKHRIYLIIKSKNRTRLIDCELLLQDSSCYVECLIHIYLLFHRTLNDSAAHMLCGKNIADLICCMLCAPYLN